MAANKWEIKGLKKTTRLCETSSLVLNKRVKVLKKSIKSYLEENTPENLHQIRIALRRVRYNMELFVICFDKKKFLIFYNLIKLLQDLTGTARDLDVLEENFKSYFNKDEENAELKLINQKKSDLKHQLEADLTGFLKSKELKDFQKML